MIKESKLVIVGLLIAGMAFTFTILLGSSGFFRHVNIFLPEVVRATVAFKNMNGQLKVVGIQGTLEVDPTLIARTGASYILTVTNYDNLAHRFYIDGLNLSTGTLYQNGTDIITVLEYKDGTYKYYDIISNQTKMIPLGTFKVVTVSKD